MRRKGLRWKRRPSYLPGRYEYDATLDGEYIGTVRRDNNEWCVQWLTQWMREAAWRMDWAPRKASLYPYSAQQLDHGFGPTLGWVKEYVTRVVAFVEEEKLSVGDAIVRSWCTFLAVVGRIRLVHKIVSHDYRGTQPSRSDLWQQVNDAHLAIMGVTTTTTTKRVS